MKSHFHIIRIPFEEALLTIRRSGNIGIFITKKRDIIQLKMVPPAIYLHGWGVNRQEIGTVDSEPLGLLRLW
jgi:hypothetical protein